MWKSQFSFRAATTFYPQWSVENKEVFNRDCGRKTSVVFSTEFLSTFHRTCGKLQTGVDIGCNITDIVLQIGIVTL